MKRNEVAGVALVSGMIVFLIVTAAFTSILQGNAGAIRFFPATIFAGILIGFLATIFWEARAG